MSGSKNWNGKRFGVVREIFAGREKHWSCDPQETGSVIVVDTTSGIRVLDADTKSMLPKSCDGNNGRFTPLAMSADGKQVACGRHTDVIVFDISELE